MATPNAKKHPSPLESLLNPDQAREFAEYLWVRVQSVANQLRAEFIPKRERYEAQMLDDFDWRGGNQSDRASRLSESALNELQNSIFDVQNDSVNIVGGFAAFMTARTADDVFGTDPYYSINPEGVEDDMLAQDMQKHSEWKMRSSTFKAAALDAIDLAFGLGEGIVKVTWCRDIDIYESDEEVLFDPATNAPILTVDGDHIFHDDVTMCADGVSIEAPKDPSIPPMPPAAVIWKLMTVEKTNVSYNGVKAHVMHYKDLLCPLSEETLEDSPFVGHRFQLRLSEAIERFNLSDELRQQFASESTEAKAEKDKPIDRLGESPENLPKSSHDDPIVEFVECWVKHDPVQDGRVRKIRAVLAVQSKEIVEMDYSANKTPKGQLPFFCVRGTKVKNRWYGRGFYEVYHKAQEFIDRNLCRVEYRNRFHSNPVVFFDPSLLIEDEDQGDFELRPGASYRLKPGVKVEECIQTFNFPDLDERTWQLMQFMIQVIQVRSGVTSAAQGEVSSLPSTATATGIESIMQSASTLSRLPMNNIKGAIESALLYSVKLIYANMDQDEVFTYFDGDRQKVGTLLSETVKKIDMNVRLLLTRFKQRESLESAGKAIDIMGKYVMLPEPEKGAQRPLFIQAIKGLGFEQADSIVRQPIQPPQMAIDPATGQPVPAPPPGPGAPGQLALPPAPPAPPAPAAPLQPAAA